MVLITQTYTHRHVHTHTPMRNKTTLYIHKLALDVENDSWRPVRVLVLLTVVRQINKAAARTTLLFQERSIVLVTTTFYEIIYDVRLFISFRAHEIENFVTHFVINDVFTWVSVHWGILKPVHTDTHIDTGYIYIQLYKHAPAYLTLANYIPINTHPHTP